VLRPGSAIMRKRAHAVYRGSRRRPGDTTSDGRCSTTNRMLELYAFREKSGEDEFEVRLTLRWREPDSDRRSPLIRSAMVFETIW
jgi:hypothetical protein